MTRFHDLEENIVYSRKHALLQSEVYTSKRCLHNRGLSLRRRALRVQLWLAPVFFPFLPILPPSNTSYIMASEAPIMDITPEDLTPEDTQPAEPVDDWSDIPEDVINLTTDEIISRTRLIDNDVKVSIQ